VQKKPAELATTRPDDSQAALTVVHILSEHPIVVITIEQMIKSTGSPADVRAFSGFGVHNDESQSHVLILDTLSVIQWREILQQWQLLGGRTVVLVPPDQVPKYEQTRSIALGVSGIVEMTPNLQKVLPQAIRAAAAGKMWISRNAFADYINETQAVLCRLREQRFTRREEQIIRLMVSGDSNKQIGHTLGITERTVKFHVSNLLQKLEVRSRRDIIKRVKSGSIGYLDLRYSPSDAFRWPAC
jgi:DNA-binding NarL/FixJ family response regulator